MGGDGRRQPGAVDRGPAICFGPTILASRPDAGLVAPVRPGRGHFRCASRLAAARLLLPDRPVDGRIGVLASAARRLGRLRPTCPAAGRPSGRPERAGTDRGRGGVGCGARGQPCRRDYSPRPTTGAANGDESPAPVLRYLGAGSGPGPGPGAGPRARRWSRPPTAPFVGACHHRRAPTAPCCPRATPRLCQDAARPRTAPPSGREATTPATGRGGETATDAPTAGAPTVRAPNHQPPHRRPPHRRPPDRRPPGHQPPRRPPVHQPVHQPVHHGPPHRRPPDRRPPGHGRRAARRPGASVRCG